MNPKTLSVLVENKPGVLARVSGLFARRAFNIHSLAVGPTEHPGVSRITVVVDAAAGSLDQVRRQLDKLVNVLKVVQLEDAVSRELIFVKVAADDTTRTNVVQIAELFRARIVDVVPDAVTIEATGTDGKVKALLTALAPYGIKEIVQSGAIGISRGAHALSEVSGRPEPARDPAN